MSARPVVAVVGASNIHSVFEVSIFKGKKKESGKSGKVKMLDLKDAGQI